MDPRFVKQLLQGQRDGSEGALDPAGVVEDDEPVSDELANRVARALSRLARAPHLEDPAAPRTTNLGHVPEHEHPAFDPHRGVGPPEEGYVPPGDDFDPGAD